MAFDWDTANTGVLTKTGKILKYINSSLALATTTLPAELVAITTPYQNMNRADLVANLFSYYGSLQSQVVSKRQTLASYMDSTYLDPVTVLSQLGVVDASIQSVMAALILQALIDSKTVNRSTVTIGTSTAQAGNVGNGTVLTTKVLDGITPPLLGAMANIHYAGLNSELSVPSDTLAMTCINAQTEGAEQWSWSGNQKVQPWDYLTEGSGQGPTVTTANGARIIVDGDFEQWTSTNTPTNWTITGGAAGTTIFRESTNIHRGTYSMKFLGNGATATIGVNQSIGTNRMKGLRAYSVSCRMKASGTPAAGAILLQFTGTNYTAASTEKIAIAAASFPTAAFTASGSLQSFIIITPAFIPSDWAFKVEIGSTLSNAVAVYFDSLAIVELPYHGGMAAIPVAGSTRWQPGDRVTFTLANNQAGVLQEGFRRGYNIQMPSSGSPSLSDNLAT